MSRPKRLMGKIGVAMIGSVFGIAYQGKTKVRKRGADLMGAPRIKSDAAEGAVKDFVVGKRKDLGNGGEMIFFRSVGNGDLVFFAVLL